MAKNKNKIIGIIFDWGGVFSRSGDPLSRPEIIKQIKISRGHINNQLTEIVNSFSRGQIKSNAYWQKYAKILNLPDITPIQLKKLYLEFTPNLGMLDLLKSLASKYQVVLLSNLNTDMKRVIIKRLKINKYFKHMIFSNDINMLKPDPAIYHFTLNKLDLSAQETLFIDDDKKNIRSAKKLGIKTILFTSEEKCRAELKRLKII